MNFEEAFEAMMLGYICFWGDNMCRVVTIRRFVGDKYINEYHVLEFYDPKRNCWEEREYGVNYFYRLNLEKLTWRKGELFNEDNGGYGTRV